VDTLQIDSPVLSDYLAGKKIYHVAPLHYLPSILADRALFSQSVLAARGIIPRKSAKRRDGMLHLSDYVHFSIGARSPLLLDKLNKGYAHAALEFDGEEVSSLPESGLVCRNAKSWGAKEAYRVIDSDDFYSLKACFSYDGAPRMRSPEVVVKYAVGLEFLTRIYFSCQYEASLFQDFSSKMGLSSLCCDVLPWMAIGPESLFLREIESYFEACHKANAILKPPDLLFD